MKSPDMRFADIEKRLRALEVALRIEDTKDCSAKDEPLVVLYGSNVDKSMAAKILGVTRATVYAMLADGRIEGAYGGSRVDVRSIERFINSSNRKDRCGRFVNRKGEHNGSDTLEKA